MAILAVTLANSVLNRTVCNITDKTYRNNYKEFNTQFDRKLIINKKNVSTQQHSLL